MRQFRHPARYRVGPNRPRASAWALKGRNRMYIGIGAAILIIIILILIL
jgi:hypothetical protein